MATVLTPDEQAWLDADVAKWQQMLDVAEPDSEEEARCLLMLDWFRGLTPVQVRQLRKDQLARDRYAVGLPPD